MHLTEEERAMASGRFGKGIKRSMDLLVKFGQAFGASRMVRVASAHIMPKGPIDLLKEFTEGVENAPTFCTLHPFMSAFDPEKWKSMGIPEAFASQELPAFNERLAIYRRLGIYQTYTCLPMLVGNLPRKGECISWIGSCAQLFVNSLLGARTNRDGAVTNLAVAVTGRAPYIGNFLDENRRAQLLVRVRHMKGGLSYTDLGAIGYYVGEKARDRNIVIDGLPPDLDLSRSLALLAPLPASGAVNLCHIPGVTPEAANVSDVIDESCERISVGKEDVTAMKGLFGGTGPVDLAVFGCPHCTISDLKTLAALLKGKALARNKRLWIGLPYQTYQLGQAMGFTGEIENAGGVITSSCMAAIPDAPFPVSVKAVATNSFKAAHYISRLTNGRVRVYVGELEACIEAVTGGVFRQ